MIQMVVFDMAGTTVNEDNVVYKTVRESMLFHGYEVSLEQVLATAAGKEKLQAITDLLHDLGLPGYDLLAKEVFADFQLRLADAYHDLDVSALPHATEVFQTLKQANICVVLNTGYDRVTAEKLIQKIGWEEGADYDTLITADDVAFGRPHPDMILLAAGKMNISPSDTIKVGDSAIDIEEGKNAGCKFSVGITTGAQTREQLQAADPDFIINDLREILDFVGIGETH
jgi:phosphonatase-like hydrolase